ncbi:sn-glycerol-3-phosphate ABC transporter ATP-binding protein UgpC [Oricola sp.]|uniref:ABC transporter ATP-binding protein n=1 Tax=Oricola sp. TaxID=1979950 RepID=UPI0025FD2397|nr:sn-glycerol-3-phosphate ABC transporter ATP-binding protein UgpC [Oricola sp.]MCI5075996.1 sn-glycerol-3-phosphate ABC transporter ATP-binding protein UgpC [Oricola sp.]
MTEIRLNNVVKAYGDVEVIHGIDLHVASGEFVVFVGPSGCGKSTLLRIIAGLEKVTGGDVVIDGNVVNTIPASERGLAMVFQSYALYPHMSVYKNMAFGLENSRMPRAEIENRVNEAAAMLQITPYLKRRPKALSGGQRQRVAIGRAIVRDPKAFLFDEPLSNLDAELRVAMRKELAALHTKLGGTMIYVTHDQIEAMTLANKIVVLNAGRVEQIGAPLDLYNKPQNTFVAGFIGSPRMNLLDAEIVAKDGGLALSAGGQGIAIPAADGMKPGDKVTFGARPEHIVIVGEGEGDIVASVDLTEQLGGETYVYCTVEGLPQLTVHQAGQLPVHRGETIHLRFDRSSMHLFDASGKVIVNGFAS